MHYRGTLASDGSQFDASYDRGSPLDFEVGRGMVIKGCVLRFFFLGAFWGGLVWVFLFFLVGGEGLRSGDGAGFEYGRRLIYLAQQLGRRSPGYVHRG